MLWNVLHIVIPRFVLKLVRQSKSSLLPRNWKVQRPSFGGKKTPNNTTFLIRLLSGLDPGGVLVPKTH